MEKVEEYRGRPAKIAKTGARNGSVSKGLTLTKDELEHIRVGIGNVVSVKKIVLNKKPLIVIMNYQDDEAQQNQ